MSPYTLQRQQWIDRPLTEVFGFFSDARNLEHITPPWIGFEILSVSTAVLGEGTIIEYRLRMHGVSMRWKTHLCEWNPPHGFADIQASGPYKLWHHTHRFESENGGTKMTDSLRYELPLGVLGRVVHKLKVRGDVARIFDYRAGRIAELFEQPERH